MLSFFMLPFDFKEPVLADVFEEDGVANAFVVPQFIGYPEPVGFFITGKFGKLRGVRHPLNQPCFDEHRVVELVLRESTIPGGHYDHALFVPEQFVVVVLGPARPDSEHPAKNHQYDDC
jgi:hypothetical protein